MINLSALKGRIALVKDIQKITGAMELVATAKLKRLSKRIGDIHQYLAGVYDVFNFIISNTEDSIYLKKIDVPIKKTLWVVITSNLGLCGGYNSNIFKLVTENLSLNDEVVAIGSKAINFCNSKKIKIKKELTDLDVNFSADEASYIASDILTWFTQKETDAVKIIYTKFINNATFEPSIIDVFPIVKKEEHASHREDIILEPDADIVMETSVSLYLNTIIFGTILESMVSEQASRRVAMEAATKNGKDLSKSLSILYNRRRQENITQEISEIVAGADAQGDN
ncbi:F0F1 ATP synthase subunit gamma [Spiroplasma clarkii]|uniref:ATP synthase gamma chain n=1 Tax=Spiroplasma clarkii TaxID=2139 RepID=A0A1Y0KZJ6_9MOLU|nr:ATP synthase F1 subunit gamma [Spiroplasma clarkii]ARU90960.1 F0F1 ATP synthase subunit gamma [Spiroplasma clarkii]ATX70402.1 F0F1 ATP synthase subunit gamma [Spiroplasma clarkii]